MSSTAKFKEKKSRIKHPPNVLVLPKFLLQDGVIRDMKLLLKNVLKQNLAKCTRHHSLMQNPVDSMQHAIHLQKKVQSFQF